MSSVDSSSNAPRRWTAHHVHRGSLPLLSGRTTRRSMDAVLRLKNLQGRRGFSLGGLIVPEKRAQTPFVFFFSFPPEKNLKARCEPNLSGGSSRRRRPRQTTRSNGSRRVSHRCRPRAWATFNWRTIASATFGEAPAKPSSPAARSVRSPDSTARLAHRRLPTVWRNRQVKIICSRRDRGPAPMHSPRCRPPAAPGSDKTATHLPAGSSSLSADPPVRAEMERARRQARPLPAGLADRLRRDADNASLLRAPVAAGTPPCADRIEDRLADIRSNLRHRCLGHLFRRCHRSIPTRC